MGQLKALAPEMEAAEAAEAILGWVREAVRPAKAIAVEPALRTVQPTR
jgi:hypothetical protein